MGFEKFKYLDGSQRPKVTLRENGQIGFSQGAVNRFNLKEYVYCELYYDSESARIGLRLTNEYEEGITAKLVLREQNFYVSARSFLDHYFISYSPARSFIAHEEEENNLIVLDLSKPLPSKRRRRRREQDMDEK